MEMYEDEDGEEDGESCSSEEQILENIKMQKELIEGVKTQPMTMRKKQQVLRWDFHKCCVLTYQIYFLSQIKKFHYWRHVRTLPATGGVPAVFFPTTPVSFITNDCD